MKKLCTLSLISLGVASVGMLAATSAGACQPSSTYCSATYTGLMLNTSGANRGEIDTTTEANNFNRKDFADNLGDREWTQAPLRDDNTSDGDSVYVHWDWYKNGSYCYPSSIGVSASSNGGGVTIGQGCTAGWNNYFTYDSAHISTHDFYWMRSQAAIDGKSDSIRALIKACQDEKYVPDECSGSRAVGISY